VVKHRVLVVEDEELLLRSITRLLTRAGFDVAGHSDVAGARAELAGPGRVDVVITDLALGTASGLDVIDAAHQRDPDLVVLVFSGAAHDEAATALGAGAAAVLPKPVVATQLIAAIQTACQRRPHP
jgi:DNA-binding NtrC family response regulator